jgi:single-strand DNA-binding protein
MASVNRVFLLGNCTRDPELRYTPKGSQVCEIGLAVNRTWTDEQNVKHEEVTFVDVTLWGRTAEVAQQYLHKGSPVFIEGRLQMDTWEDKQTGQKRSRLRVVGENLQLLGDRRESSAPPSRPPQRAGAPPSTRLVGVREPDPNDIVPF